MKPVALAYSVADRIGAAGCGTIAGFEAAEAGRRRLEFHGFCRGLEPGAGGGMRWERVSVPRIPLLGRTGWGKRWLWRFEAGWFDSAVAARLPPSEYFHGWAFQALACLGVARARGTTTMIERGNSHVLDEVALHREERLRLGIPGSAIFDHPAAIERSCREYDAVDRLLVPSTFVRDSMLRRGVPAGRLVLLPLGVDHRVFRPGAWPRPGPFTVGFVGRLTAIKGVRDLVDGFRLAAIPGARLLLMGPRGLDDRYLGDLGAGGIEVVAPGGGDEVGGFLRRIHLAAVPSIEDGFARVTTEAMACATPVLATPNVGAAEWIRDRVEGYRVPIRSPEAIAACLVHAAADLDRLAAMGAAATHRVAGMSWEWYSGELFEQLVAARAGTPRAVRLPAGLA